MRRPTRATDPDLIDVTPRHAADADAASFLTNFVIGASQ